MPDAVDVPGLLTGDTGEVGASQPNAIPAVEPAFNEIVNELQLTVYVAIGVIVLAVIVIGTVAVQELIVLVKTQE